MLAITACEKESVFNCCLQLSFQIAFQSRDRGRCWYLIHSTCVFHLLLLLVDWHRRFLTKAPYSPVTSKHGFCSHHMKMCCPSFFVYGCKHIRAIGSYVSCCLVGYWERFAHHQKPTNFLSPNLHKRTLQKDRSTEGRVAICSNQLSVVLCQTKHLHCSLHLPVVSALTHWS